MARYAQERHRCWSMVILGVVLMATISACTRVEIQKSDGTVSINHYTGFLGVELEPKSGAQVVDVEGIGIVGLQGGYSVGYHHAQLTALPHDGCRLVLWVKTDQELRTLNDLLKDRSDICAINHNKNRGSEK